jgi:large subunit ribosomal protein L4
MASLTVYNTKGDKVGTYDLDPAELAPRINKQLLHDAVVMYQANARQGSAKTKTRAEVKATTKKLYRQKGTGNARAGSRVSGIRRGGGHIFAIRPRDYSYSLNKKSIRLATRMALASKLRSGSLTLLDELSFSEPKTRDMAATLKALDCDSQRVLISIAAHDANVHKSGRNIAGVDVLPASDLNALAILSARRVVMTTGALDVIRQQALGKTGDKAEADN